MRFWKIFVPVKIMSVFHWEEEQSNDCFVDLLYFVLLYFTLLYFTLCMLCKAIQLKVERIFLSQMALNSWIQQSKDMLDFMFWTTLLDCSTFCSFHCRSRVTMMTITNHSGVHGVHISKFHTLNSGTTTPIPLECIQLSFDVSFSWKECLPLVEWILLCVDYIGTGMSPIQKKIDPLMSSE